MRISFLSLVFFLSFTADVAAQAIFKPVTDSSRLRIRAERTSQKITVDGILSESDWQSCQIASNFIQSNPHQGKKATYETEVRVLYDDKNIYIGAVCHNPGGKVLVQDLRRDFIYSNNDLFGVFIDAFRDVQSPVESFLVTPLSTQRDLLIYDDRIYDLNWDAVWSAKCTVNDSSWMVEMAIPWSTLRYPSGSTTWAINFNRNIRAFNEITGWSPWPFAFTVGRMAYSGLVTNLQPPENKANISAQPYVLTNTTNNSSNLKSKTKLEEGGELKWLVNTNTSIEGTLNTDFAQVDADQQVINLSRSAVFFPEKRQFFLENANLFAVGQDGIIQPFFSRSIGLDNNGNPLKIDEGARLIHQDSREAFGALFIHQTDQDSSTSSWFGVLRAQRNLSAKARIGALVTYRYDEMHGLTNTVASVDGYWHISQPFYIRPMISATMPANGAKGGMAYFTEAGYFTNTTAFQLFETYVSPNYQPKTGFLERTNFINTQPNLIFTFPVNWFNKTIRYYTPGLFADIYHNAYTGQWQEAHLNVTPFQVVTPRGNSLALIVQSSWQNIVSPYAFIPQLTVNPGIYRYTRLDCTLNTDQSVPYSVLADISTGGFYNGKLSSCTFTLRAVPIPNIAAGVTYTYDAFKGFTAGNQTVKTYLIAPELRVSFTPKIQLNGFYQYNTVSNQGGLNMRFAWEYKPLSFIYLVFNDLQTYNIPGLQTGYRQQQGIFKISYITQL